MDISGVSSYGYTSGLADLYGTQETDSVSADTLLLSLTGSGQASQSDSLDLSKPGEIYSKLQQLAKSDPEKLKEVCADIAKKLKSAAESESGNGAKMLSDLAQKFQNVADGGDVSQLKPPDPPSFSGGTARAIDRYAQQKGASLAEMMANQASQSSQHAKNEQLFSSILSEINDALGE